MIIDIRLYREKLMGCWMGKNIGGTLGAPMEWRRQRNEVSFYIQDLHGEPLANDDLDIQLLWLIALEERGTKIDALTLADYWCLYVTPHWAEYGTAKINMRAGLPPPLSGSYRNAFKHSCGAFIRSEIWACIAPGMPDVAAAYALEDAILDHGDGEGTYAAVFCAALESAAFLIDDLEALIDIGLSYIPADCGIARAVATARDCFAEGLSLSDSRDRVLERHRGSSFMRRKDRFISADDVAKGFAEGEFGYDAPSNIAFTVLALLRGGDDFGQVVCDAVNFGEDTDCTAATAGAIYGIRRGFGSIPPRWIEPIGRGIKTCCLNLGELGFQGANLPQEVGDLSARTERIARLILGERPERGLRFSDDGLAAAPFAKPIETPFPAPDPTLKESTLAAQLRSHGGGGSLYRSLCGPRYSFPFFELRLDYGDGPEIRDGEEKRLVLIIENRYKTQANLTIQWLSDETWLVAPSRCGAVLSFPPHIGDPARIEFRVTIEKIPAASIRASILVHIEGRPTAMAIPVVFLNGNLNGRE